MGIKGKKKGQKLPRHHSDKFTLAFIEQYDNDPYHQSILAEIGTRLEVDGYFRKDEVVHDAGAAIMKDSIRWDVLELMVEDNWNESLTPLSERFWSRKVRDKAKKTFKRVTTTDDWRRDNAHKCLAGSGPAKTVGYCKLTHEGGLFTVRKLQHDVNRATGVGKVVNKRLDECGEKDVMPASDYKRLKKATGCMADDILLEDKS